MLEVNLDYAKNLDLTVRRNGFSELTINTYLNGAPFNFSGGTVQLLLFSNKFNNIPYLTKTSGIDTDYINITSNVISIKLWKDLSALNTQKYFWCIVYTDSNGEPQYWLVGDYKAVSGQSDEDALTSGTTINITTLTQNIYLNIFSGSGSSSSSSVYNALITQSSTGAPTAAILSNTLIPAPTWSRISAGVYKLSQTGGFNQAKTSIVPVCGMSNYITPNYVLVKFDTDNNLLVETWDSNLTPTDGILSSFPIKIEIFN